MSGGIGREASYQRKLNAAYYIKNGVEQIKVTAQEKMLCEEAENMARRSTLAACIVEVIGM